jgi:hypothetical protein
MRTIAPLPVLILAPICLLAAQGAGTGRPGRRAILGRAEEIALARSAAPGSIAKGARIYVFTDSGYGVADQGTTDVACLVSRSWPDALEPSCYDAEAAATVMPIEMRRVLLFHLGKAAEAVEQEIARGLMEGTYRLPVRLAVVYMMSSGQRLISDDGQPRGRWRPHLMIHYPFLTAEAVGHHGEPSLAGGMVVDPGRPLANLMVVVPQFVDPEKPVDPRAR